MVYSNNFCKTIAELKAIEIPREEKASDNKTAKTRNTKE
jgi:hypothetical protein